MYIPPCLNYSNLCNRPISFRNTPFRFPTSAFCCYLGSIKNLNWMHYLLALTDFHSLMQLLTILEGGYAPWGWDCACPESVPVECACSCWEPYETVCWLLTLDSVKTEDPWPLSTVPSAAGEMNCKKNPQTTEMNHKKEFYSFPS